jgi:hypothetical protein
MTSNDEAAKAEFIALIQRYCELGRQLPSETDILAGDASAIATAKVLLAEMNQTKAAIERMPRRRKD